MTKFEIMQLQKALRETVEPTITVDGISGNQTTAAIKKFETAHGVDTTGAMQLLQTYIAKRFVAASAFKQNAQLLNVKESHLHAVAEVESHSESFLRDGTIKILFERHWFYKKLKAALLGSTSARVRIGGLLKVEIGPGIETTVAKIMIAMETKYKSICSTTTGGYLSDPYAEWGRLKQAMDFDIEAGCQSASFGGFQIMGFNHTAAGFPTARDMMIAMAESETVQFNAVCRFIQANKEMLVALRNGQWATFASMYNGSDYAKNKYDVKLAAAVVKWSKELGV